MWESAEFHVESARAASEKCRQLVREGKANLFRGQPHDWLKLIPSLFRTTGESRSIAFAELDYFKRWARYVPQMGIYGGDDESLTAIAQHYGIPTSFLDLTTDPEIALLFAKTSNDVDPSTEAVIYCFLEEGLRSLDKARLTRINIDNLWRKPTLKS